MPQLGQAQQGQLKSTPKMVRINGDDADKVIFRNMGNNHAYPFIWSDVVTFSGTSVVLASGVDLHGYDLATYGKYGLAPLGVPSGRLYIEANTTTNVVELKSTSSQSSAIDVSVIFMLGTDADVSGVYCRGNNGAAQSLP